MGLEKCDFSSSAEAHKATLERTMAWAEKAAFTTATQPLSVHTSDHHKSQPAEPSGLGSPLVSPSTVNPRDIPLEHRGGSHDPRDAPKDPRDREAARDARDGGPDREPGEIYEERVAAEGRRESRDSGTMEIDSERQRIKSTSGGGDRRRSESHESDRADRSDWEHKDEPKDSHEQGYRERDDRPKEKVTRDFYDYDAKDKAKKDYEHSASREHDREREKDREKIGESDKSPARSSEKKRSDSYTKSRSPSPISKQLLSPVTRKSRTKSPDGTRHLDEETEPGTLNGCQLLRFFGFAFHSQFCAINFI